MNTTRYLDKHEGGLNLPCGSFQWGFHGAKRFPKPIELTVMVQHSNIKRSEFHVRFALFPRIFSSFADQPKTVMINVHGILRLYNQLDVAFKL
jgi:hypothetical protein